jgi:arylsulfatase A-like enzyme
LARYCNKPGYKTGIVGKWGLGGPLTEGIPNKQGFDFFYGYNCQRQAHTYFPVHLWKNTEKVPLEQQNGSAPHRTSRKGQILTILNLTATSGSLIMLLN